MVTSGISQNKVIFGRWLSEVWNNSHYEIADELISPDFTAYGAGGQPIHQGPSGLVEFIKTWRGAFPDGQMQVHALLSEGEFAVSLLTWRGTHLGDFYGIPATGKQIELTSIGLDRIVNDKCAEGWGEADMLGLMEQLGAVPKISQGQYAWSPTPPPTASLSPVISDNKNLMLRHIKALNDGSLEDARDVIDVANYTEYNPLHGLMNFDAFWQSYNLLHSSLPDFQFTPDLDLMVADNDLILVRGVLTGTHTGTPLLGVPASGKQLEWTASGIYRIADGKLVTCWLCPDNLRLVQQLGLVPSMS